tara:strand:+ start:788 stop:973 length:186 start_codon:yes stop_codon:yes gene_type:complete
MFSAFELTILALLLPLVLFFIFFKVRDYVSSKIFGWIVLPILKLIEITLNKFGVKLTWKTR